ncbi:Flavohemoprotein [Gracilariopsis chorda]|uniref:Flavohemoprotein n=1 Tax=Gracilariopsis chorda TaxID=448386 RepID=A0A2V3J537_9FLOR|nr:Flavohemoprotein [Gracilariopsis chorda]|eukprot:PXF49541.1 Flavohemoprotein [Gracilariopsis chorda]
MPPSSAMALRMRKPKGSALIDPETEALIKNTLPIFTKHSQQIAVQLYANLFEQHPQLKPMFCLEFLQTPGQCKKSPGTGMSPQAKILSDSIVNFCANLDNIDMMNNAIERICAKHVSRHVKSDHYPAVAGAFSRAVRQVLKNELSESDLKAWDTAVSALAGVLVKAEKEMYDCLKHGDRHWKGFREFSVQPSEAGQPTAAGNASRKVYAMSASDGSKLPRIVPGESICVRVQHEEFGLVHYGLHLVGRPNKTEIHVSLPGNATSSKTSSHSVVKEKLEEGHHVELSSPMAYLTSKKRGKSVQSRALKHDLTRVQEASRLPGVITRGQTTKGVQRQVRRMEDIG